MPPAEENINTAPAYVPPDERPWRGKILAAVAFAALLVIAFVIGTFMHGFEPSEVKAAQKNPTPQAPQASTPTHRSDVTLVPVSGSDVPQVIEQPITTAPAAAAGQQPNDATALPAQEYAAAAARAKAERDVAKKNNPVVDPRSITGAPYQDVEKPKPAERSNAATNAPNAIHATRATHATRETNATNASDQPPAIRRTASRTAAYLESKPLPHIFVDHDITARLNLTVSPEGRVTDIDVNQPIPEMGKLVQAVQNWRFRPATENGTPVTAKVAVDITFRANE
ncbi:MAG: energy transducer TonB [Acidobacteriota bacterium]|nr:energy transducer TonB [Acidobacteriota bacterium]